MGARRALTREVTDMAEVKKLNDKAWLVGINHVALEVGSIEEALAFYSRLFEFSLRGRSAKMAFIDIGDQFINLSENRSQHSDEERHFGLVVDDKEKVRRRLKEVGVKTLPG
jgi:lactoylglutathione lyase